jgi:hypothetical protein
LSTNKALTDIQTLLAIEELRKLEARYARYADEKRWDDLAGLFTPDGSFVSNDASGNPIAVMNGRQQITDDLTAVSAGDVSPIHMLLTSEIDIVSPTTAHAIWAMADLIFRNDEPPADSTESPPFRTMRGWGHYHVDYTKVDDTWQISKRLQTRTRLEFTA